MGKALIDTNLNINLTPNFNPPNQNKSHMDAGGGNAVPTGCYKCGRPGHWSRDCPSNPSNNKDLDSNAIGGANFSNRTLNSFNNNALKSDSAAEKPKTIRKTRPKLTPDLLLSNDGLGHILRHFPRAFKYRGRGHEVSDLGNLLGMYAEWHSHLLPYYSFDQFVHKVEQIGAKNRVKKCMRDLKERVASGVDPTKLHESQYQEDMSNHDQVASAMDLEEQNPCMENNGVQTPASDNHQEKNINDIPENAMEMNQEPMEPTNDKMAPAHLSSVEYGAPTKDNSNTLSCADGALISEEQRARMRANRLKALEKAAARVQKLQ